MTTDTELRPAGESQKQRNTVGIIALVAAIVGAIFAVIPGALILGWILLPIAFVLSIVSLFMKGQRRGRGVAALIISIVGTIIGMIVFIGVVGSAFDDAFTEDTEVETPADTEEQQVDDANTSHDETPARDAAEGTRDNPLPIGSTVRTDDWEITIDEVDLDATAQLSADAMNGSPEDGNGYVLIGMTATYIGDDPEGATPWASVKFVTSGGNTVDNLDSLVFTDNSFDSLGTLYEGASTSGYKALEVPLDDITNGTLRVSPDLFADDKFFAVQ